MRPVASVRNRPTWIVGRPTAWRGADAPGEGASPVPFGFDITEDGAGYYLLVCFSADGQYGADTWHPTLADAYESAEQQFGIRPDEWGPGLDE